MHFQAGSQWGGAPLRGRFTLDGVSTFTSRPLLLPLSPQLTHSLQLWKTKLKRQPSENEYGEGHKLYNHIENIHVAFIPSVLL